MHTSSEQDVSRRTFFVSALCLVILVVLAYAAKDQKQVSPEAPISESTELIPNLQVILDQETETMRNQQIITEIGWSDIISFENLNEYGIPQTWYRVQLIDNAHNSAELTQFSALAPSMLSESDLMIRPSPDYDWRKQALIMKYTSNDKVFYFIPRQLVKGTSSIDEG